jgi:hypothetical protein
MIEMELVNLYAVKWKEGYSPRMMKKQLPERK